MTEEQCNQICRRITMGFFGTAIMLVIALTGINFSIHFAATEIRCSR